MKIITFKVGRGLLPALCVAAALAAAITTVKAADKTSDRRDDPGSSAADATGMGNSFEYPNSNQYQTEASPRPQSEQRAGAVAPTDNNPKINTDTHEKNPGSCTDQGSSSNCSPKSGTSGKSG